MYTLTKTEILADNKETTVYGIKNGREEYRDISTDKREVEALCDLFNESELDELHFKDAVEDFIVGKAFCIHGEKDL